MNKKYIIFGVLAVALVFISSHFNNLELNSKSSRAFYIDATQGDDLNDGLTPETAWRSIEKVNSMQFNIDKDKVVFDKQYMNSQFLPGDKILFKRGGVWREKLYILSSGEENDPIVFGAYGEGPKPIIDGGQCLSLLCEAGLAWGKVEGSIYKLETKKDIGVITEDGAPLIFVSWEPNKDNFKKMIPGSSLFDYENKILYLWTKNSDNPNAHNIIGAIEEVLLKPLNSEYFIARDIEFRNAAGTCVKPENIKHARFEDLEIHNCGGLWNTGGPFYFGNGITIIFNSEDVAIENNLIYDVYDSAISPQTFWHSNLLMKDIFIKNNTMYNAPHSVIEITNWADDSIIENIVVEDNKIYNTNLSFSKKYNLNRPEGGPGILITSGNDRKSRIKNINIKSNEIFNNPFEGIAIGLNSGPVNIINNNIYGNKGSGIMIFDDKKPTITGASIINNKIINNGDDILAYEGLSIFKSDNFIINNGDLKILEQIKRYIK